MTERDIRSEMKDALTEIFNVGIGRAACVLSELIGDEILLTVPQLGMMKRSEFIELAGQMWKMPACIVRQSFNGPFCGDALLIFPARDSLELVRVLLAEPSPIETMTELEREALLEVGNIILNACISCIADMIGHEITNALPVYIDSAPGVLIESLVLAPDWYVIFLHIDFTVQRTNLTGNIVFILDVPAIDAFGTAVMSLIEQFNGEP
ncbi:MAG: hypothetical protein WCK65_03480 [Rhodospirillaceae bacterium]